MRSVLADWEWFRGKDADGDPMWYRAQVPSYVHSIISWAADPPDAGDLMRAVEKAGRGISYFIPRKAPGIVGTRDGRSANSQEQQLAVSGDPKP